MAKKVILSADSTCDIGPVLREKFDVQFFDYHIQIGDKSFVDNVDITPGEIFKTWREQGILPKTAAITPGEYAGYFEEWVAAGHEVLHINLGSGITSSYHNCTLAAEDLPGVYVVDSANLSTGFGQLVVKAGEMIAAGMDAAAIQQKLTEMRAYSHGSFVLDTLEFMRAGGRCSAVQAFGANLLNLKVGIQVHNDDGGKMDAGKKYKGPLERALPEYVRDELAGKENLDLTRIFITHTGMEPEIIEMVKGEISKYATFNEVYDTVASCCISAHAGPRTLGILYMTKPA